MIKSIQFKNFKVLRDCTLPLSQFTLLIGPNGTGKSTALAGIRFLGGKSEVSWDRLQTIGIDPRIDNSVQVVAIGSEIFEGIKVGYIWAPGERYLQGLPRSPSDPDLREGERKTHLMKEMLAFARSFSFDAKALAQECKLVPDIILGENGDGLAVVLDRLRDSDPERFELLNQELSRWIPEFDRVLFDTPSEGTRSIRLRISGSQNSIPAKDLSHGTLLALGILTLAYLPVPPSILCLEEPDRGLHPRLLRDVRDAMYRLAYPDQYGDKRQPVQVIATTHSPYMLELFRDHPEEVVIAQKLEGNVKFERLSDRTDLDEILQGLNLGDAWYSGILGGVPANR
jgi:predicted ATPase